jgi:transcription initiation factor IIE alpha subunit
MRVIENHYSKVIHAVSQRLQTEQRGILLVSTFCSKRFTTEADRDETEYSVDWSDVTCGICQSALTCSRRRDPEWFEKEKKISDMSPAACTREFLARYRRRMGHGYSGDTRHPPSERVRLWRKDKEKHTRCSKCGAALQEYQHRYD